ncbi:hypothetical protein AZI85_14205 [Bdellovibrio bacteriovorus]|uniref:Uncharacterized protein n=1 Tax=Bdellovibrio bacteriovorus TaxID=959 RepID=A0A150WVH8_BDEBC|nr:hypothetical protein [Bdellovibrio bacteriovorus]KYG70292.1 hypothetical protein AZI85_14205 [Bdellovibrio bacteriovorus]
MLRAGRFRHRLLDDTFLKTQGPVASECLQPFLSLWQQKRLSDVEIVAVYIFIFAFLRRPKDFLGGVHNEFPLSPSAESSLRSETFLEILRRVLPTELKDAKSLRRFENTNFFVDQFCSLSWRSIPLAVPKSIIRWRDQVYPLELLVTLPLPEEVLAMQAQGRRCISMLIEKEQILNFVEEGRDVLGFIVHDLIHADHFFADPEKARAQIEFCKRLRVIASFSSIQQMLEKDDSFRREFHYLMSDMNSVPLHLLKTLKAILLGFYKRQLHLEMADSLPPAVEDSFTHFFKDILAPWNFSEQQLIAAQRLNTAQYKGREDGELLHQALSTNFHDETANLC